MTDLESTKPLYEFSVKLCAAVKKYKCLHDQKSYLKNIRPECEDAWELVAKECNESVDLCKNRWRNLWKSFFDGLKRRKNTYYLHDHLKFLLEKPEKKRKKNSVSTFDNETNFNSPGAFQKSYEDCLSLHESELKKSIHVFENDDASQTTSADESNEILQKTESGGIFIINEIEESAFEEPGNSFGDERRLSYKRSCKRALDPEVIGELEDEEPEGKRTRRSDKYNLASQLNNKSPTVRLDKLKINMIEKKVVPVKGKMVDRFTCTDLRETRDCGTQYELNSLDFDEIFMQSIKTQLMEMNGRQKMSFKRKIYQSMLEVFDDANDFPNVNETLSLPPKQAEHIVNATTGELRLMRELAALVQAAKITPEIVNANEKATTSTPIQSKPTLKMPLPIVDNRPKPKASPIPVSPPLDDDDLQFFIDNIDDEDDAPLPRSWDEIKAKPIEPIAKTTVEDNIAGLPRHILQKVVRVAGPSGSTIVTRDGDKKRIYRIFPKMTNPNANHSPQPKNDNNGSTFITSVSKNFQDTRKDNGVGTFYIASTKNPNDTQKINSNLANITIRSVANKPTTNINQTTSPVNISNQPTNSNNTNNNTNGQTTFKNVHPANRILSSSTGYFKMVPSTKTVTPTYIQKPPSIPGSTTNINPKIFTAKMPVKPMLPPNSNVASPRIQAIRTGAQIMQRRYSICGSSPAEKPNSFATNSSAAASKTVTSTNNGNPTAKSGVSQIQISQPISLNANAQISTNNFKNVSKNSSEDMKQSLEPSKVADTANELINPDATAINSSKQRQQIPILQTAGTVEADDLDPLFVKPQEIKSEPIDD